LFPSMPNNTRITKFNEATGGNDPAYVFVAGTGWTQSGVPNGSATLAPGETVFFRNPTTNALTVTFVGEVLEGNLSFAVPPVTCFRSSMIPLAGGLDALGFPTSVN